MEALDKDVTEVKDSREIVCDDEEKSAIETSMEIVVRVS